MKTLSKTYEVYTDYSHRTIQARTQREAKEMFRRQLKGFISEHEKITIR